MAKKRPAWSSDNIATKSQQDTAESQQVTTTYATVPSEHDQLLALIFPNLDLTQATYEGEITTISPFPRLFDSNNQPIYENVPSFSINIKTGKWIDHANPKFKGGSLISLAIKLERLPTIAKSQQLVDDIVHADYTEQFQFAINTFQNRIKDADTKQNWTDKWHFSVDVAKQLNIGFTGAEDELYTIPVYLFGRIVDTRTYRPRSTPKVKSQPKAQAGLIVGKPIWENDPKPTWICEGEKDMIAMRSLGYNAICITGGANKLPELFANWFEDKTVIVAYDNDDAGKKGALKLCAFLKKCKAEKVYNFTAHHTDKTLGAIKGADMWDVIHTYADKAKSMLDAWLSETVEFTDQDSLKVSQLSVPLIPLQDCEKEEHIGELRQSVVQAWTGIQQNFVIPKSLTVKKVYVGEKESKNTLVLGTTYYWDLDDYNVEDILYLLQNESQQATAIKKGLVNTPPGEEGLWVNILKEITINRISLLSYTDTALENSAEPNSENYSVSAYVIGKTMQPGHKYNIVYRFVGDPLNKQKGVLLVTDIQEINDIKNWTLTTESKQNLKRLALPNHTILKKINYHWDQDLARLILFNNKRLWLLYCLLFNTPLKFKMFDRVYRATLDMIAIGESRAGKSELSKVLMKKYNVGKRLNADSSTVDSFLGGAVDSPNGPVVKAGTLLRENEGLVVIEEIKDRAAQLIPKMRDLRSEGILKLARVADQIEAKLQLRLLMIANPKVEANEYLNIRQNFDDGLETVKSIIPATEDLTRFDVLFLVDSVENLEKTCPTPDPTTYTYVDKVHDKWYQDAIRWVWSRKVEQIVFADGIENYIFSKGKEISKALNTMENIYGTEAHIKLARLSIALAGFLLSSDSDFEKLIVKKEHVDFIVRLLIGKNSIFFNDLFRWQETVQRQMQYRECLDSDIKAVEFVWLNKGNELLDIFQKMGADGLSYNALLNISGLEKSAFDLLINKLRKNNLIYIGKKGNWHRAGKFRKALQQAIKHEQKKGILEE